MGSTTDKLKYLNATKAAIKDAIIAKGVEVSDTDTFENYATRVSEIVQTTDRLYLNDSIKLAYSTLSEFPTLETSNMTYMYGMFQDCINLTTIPQLNTSNVTDMNYMFWNCYALTTIPQLNTTNVGNMQGMFQDCYALTEMPQLDTQNVTNMLNMFYGCRLLTTIPELNTSKVTSMGGIFTNCSALRYLLINNLGAQSNVTLIDFRYSPNLGVEDSTIPSTVGARQALIDTLLTYSHDRETAGYENCSIMLHANTKALLTEDELNQISAKGFTIA